MCLETTILLEEWVKENYDYINQWDNQIEFHYRGRSVYLLVRIGSFYVFAYTLWPEEYKLADPRCFHKLSEDLEKYLGPNGIYKGKTIK